MRITRTLVCLAATAATTSALWAQEKSSEVVLKEIVVSAVRVTDSVPMAFTEISKKDIERLNLGQDLPVLMNFTPSVVATTYDGTGVGYTDYRIRGIDNSRINVTINGVPYNDADSQTTFFVNLQDFASSLGSIQIQRGVGSSTYGAAAFGASVSLATSAPSANSFARYSGSLGSFGTQKTTLQFGTGLRDGFALEGRLSAIESDGYVDRATSDLKSYFLNALWQDRDQKGTLNLLVFGGTETTGLSFFGLDRAGLAADRTTNYDGIYYDALGEERIYPNQTDNYQQDHIQLHYQRELGSNLTLSSSLHYTNGKGYYEQIQDFDNPFVFFRAIDLLGDGADYASRAHLDSEFCGLLTSLEKRTKNYNWQWGLSVNRYLGDQYGRMIAADTDVLSRLPYEFYRNDTDKSEWNTFFKYQRNLSEALSVYADLQSRNISYQASGTLFADGASIDVDQSFHFFNPKFGFNYRFDRDQLYASVARAHREPARVDFENGNPRAERLDDFEFGYRMNRQKWQLALGGFYMNYKDQLVLTGALDAFNFPIRENVGSSYRAGVEADMRWLITNSLTLTANATVSRHRNRDFVTFRDGALTDLGDTRISFAPELITGSALEYAYSKEGAITLFFKHVGEQFMSNIEHEDSLLFAYSVFDLNVSHSFTFSGPLKEARLSLQVNNLLNEQYENNGYFYSFDDAEQTFYGAGFYPQATRNFLAGVTLTF